MKTNSTAEGDWAGFFHNYKKCKLSAHLKFLRVSKRMLRSEDSEDVSKNAGNKQLDVFTLMLKELFAGHMQRQTYNVILTVWHQESNAITYEVDFLSKCSAKKWVSQKKHKY